MNLREAVEAIEVLRAQCEVLREERRMSMVELLTSKRGCDRLLAVLLAVRLENDRLREAFDP